MQAITCAELVESLGAYHDGELSSIRRHHIDAHLGRCARCRNYAKSYAATVGLAKSAMKDPGAATPQPLPEDLVQAILAARAKRK
jgi:predicted anti-sigma-YlaC factor YlaD